jgi:nitric oxide reductase subunit B
MRISGLHIGKVFLTTAICMLLLALVFGVVSASIYIFPDFLKDNLGFISLRPMHVSAAMFWIILGATGCIYCVLEQGSTDKRIKRTGLIQWVLWVISIIGIMVSYCIKDFGGREYWEFNPIWALPISIAWVLFLINFYRLVKKIRTWPVYIWMWLTGVVFFLFTFLENYLWLIPYFREHFITDMTIQWKVNGSLVGSWNQIIYGTAIFLMDRILNNKSTGSSKLAFGLYFLGLFNLMFNWGHHIYTLPTEPYIRYIGYAVSMTEWVFFVKIVMTWRASLSIVQRNYHYFPYRFIMAADIWIFINMGQAILMSIPAINMYTHGTHITVAHAMGTTIGINTMILLAACFTFFNIEEKSKYLNKIFWALQISLVIFWTSLNLAGVKKGIWQLSAHQESYSKMMDSLAPYFVTFGLAGIGLLLTLGTLGIVLLKSTSASTSNV